MLSFIFLSLPMLVMYSPRQASAITTMKKSTTHASNRGTILSLLEAVKNGLNDLKSEVSVLNAAERTMQKKMESVVAGQINVEDGQKITQTKVANLHMDNKEMNGTIAAINNNLASVQTDVNTIKSKEQEVDGTLKAMNNNVASVKTDVNTIKSKEEEVDGTLKAMKNNVASVKTDVNTIKSKEEEVDGTLKAMKNNVASVKTDVETIKSRQEKIDADVAFLKESVHIFAGTFLGRGDTGHCDESPVFNNMELAGCLRLCYSKMIADHQWNGVLYVPAYKLCYCQKNDRGHHDNTYALHFRFT